MFRDPPGTGWITGLSEIEIIEDSFLTSGLGVHVGCADVDTCCHRLRLR